MGFDGNLGIGEYWQLRVSKEQIKETGSDTPSFYGYGPTSVAVKWRFLDNNNFKMAIYPSYQFDDATTHDDEPKVGRTIYVPVIVLKTFGRFTVIANVGENKNLDHSEKHSTLYSLAGGWALSDKSRIMAEFATEKFDEGQEVEARVGFVREVFQNEKSNYETAVFGSVAHNVGWTDDHVDHSKLLFGFSIAKKPKSETH